jgi:pyroglutamyl-peptidase
MTVLLTGFEPFAGEQTNPSADIARALDGEVIEGHSVIGVVLPCVFGNATTRLNEHLSRVDPALVICLGLAGGRASISMERVAINLDDARIPDEAGQQPRDRAVIEAGPAAYFSSLPVKAMTRALSDAGLPAEVSHTAGTFVCNHVFYGLMHALTERSQTRGGFVHVPFATEQGARHGAAGLAIEEQIRGVRLAIAAALTHERDTKITGGATH